MKLAILITLLFYSGQLFANYNTIVQLLNEAAAEYSKSKVDNISIFKRLRDAKVLVDKSLQEKRGELAAYQKEFDNKTVKWNWNRIKLKDLKNEVNKLENNALKLSDEYVTLYRQYKGYDREITEIKDIKKIPPSVLYKFDRAMQSIMDKITKGNLDSRFLLSNLDDLKTTLRLNDAAIMAFKMNSYKNLNNTVVGNYVNGQVKKAMGNFCSFNRSCAYNSVADAPRAVQNIVESLLNHPEESQVEINETGRSYKIETEGESSGPIKFNNVIQGK